MERTAPSTGTCELYALHSVLVKLRVIDSFSNKVWCWHLETSSYSEIQEENNKYWDIDAGQYRNLVMLGKDFDLKWCVGSVSVCCLSFPLS